MFGVSSESVSEHIRRRSAAVRQVRPAWILTLGWLGLFIYAYPGFMSFDSVWQHREARSGVFTDWHPPTMAALWRLVELVVAGPFGMLIIQSACFLVGAFLVLRRHMSPRAAAVAASVLLWFPPIGTILAVIWKDSQMLGFLMLGLGLLGHERRGMRVVGLAVLVLATTMRHNAFTMTFALVGLLFTWSPELRGWRRYAIAAAAWIAVTLTASVVNRALTDRRTHPWHSSLALFDIVGTLRFAPAMTDDELRSILDGVPMLATEDLHRRARQAHDPVAGVFRVMERGYLAQPSTKAQRLAVARAWKTLVFEHPGAYLKHRWRAYRELLHLGDTDLGPQIFIEFSDGRDVEDTAHPGRIQNELRPLAQELSTTWLYAPYTYLLLALALLPFCVRDRELLALLLSGLISEAALFFVAPTPDFRYSIWLATTTMVILTIVVARRVRLLRAA